MYGIMKKHRIRYRVEYWLVCLALVVVRLVPVRAAWALARCVGSAIYALLSKRRRIAVQNLLATGVAATPAEARRIAKASMQNFALLALESILCPRFITPERYGQFVEDQSHPEAKKFLLESKEGCIVVSGHIGNWEVLARVASFFKPMTAIARRMNNPLVQNLIQNGGSSRKDEHGDLEFVDKNSSDRFALLRALRNGRQLAILFDQYNRQHGIPVPFMGIPAWTVVSPARLVMATHCTVIFGGCFRTKPGHFVYRADAPIRYELTGDREADAARIMADLNRRLERYVREFPEQYLWSHRRWRNDIDPSAIHPAATAVFAAESSPQSSSQTKETTP